MKHLFSEWDSIKKEIETRYVYLFLDCDGTLAPIADTPDKASIPQKTKESLTALSRLENLRLAIISGRSLTDIKTIVGLTRIIYVGNHGLEVEDEGVTSRWKVSPSYKKDLEDIKARLIHEYDAMPGIFVEDKDLSLSLHYRMAGIDEVKVRAIFHKVVDPYKASGKIAVMHGKKVSEIRPAMGWDKGKIVKWLLARERLAVMDENIIAVYVGDDQTDEKAFKALEDNGISVMVGKILSSSAKYYVDDTDEVYKLLTMILKARSD